MTRKTTKDIDYEVSTGNVYADLGFTDAGEMLAKARIVAHIGRIIQARKLTQVQAATGRGEMLTALTPVRGSAGYVAIERVTGTLHGRAGSFVFQHTGTMRQGAQRLSISVVPDSGTGALAGLEGDFKLTVVDGRHLYEFEYSLPSP